MLGRTLDSERSSTMNAVCDVVQVRLSFLGRERSTGLITQIVAMWVSNGGQGLRVGKSCIPITQHQASGRVYSVLTAHGGFRQGCPFPKDGKRG